MMFRLQASLRVAASLAALLIVSACSDDRPAKLSAVATIDIPTVVVGTQANQNIGNPTLEIPPTFPVADGDELTLVWSDEFDGPEIDPEVWFFATGDGTEKGLPGGWGNRELQYYLPDNAMIVNGVLEITARREKVGDLNYTSARLNTEDRFAFKYGRIEARIKLPSGQGLWPAFWMLSQDSDYLCGGNPCRWAAVGEIDIVEAVNLDGTGGNEIFGTIHYGGEAPANQRSESRYTPSVDVTEDFHIYALEWDENEIRWYFDGQLYAVENSWFSNADNQPYPAPFNQNFHILLNLAVGGNFPGSPNGTTPFPATMQVDWVRVYSGEEPQAAPADRGNIPDDVMYATDQNETVDLVATFTPFGTTSGLNGAYALDADFNPAFQVVSGTGYGIPHIAQLGLVDLPAGFAAGYASFTFKIKSDNLPGNFITVKLQDGGSYGNVTLTDTSVSTPLGNGWYEVVLPMSGFSGVATGTGVVFEAQDQATGFSFLLTDIGFNNAGTGGGNAGVVPEDVMYATDQNETVDLVATFTPFGTTSALDGAYALDPDFNPAFRVASGTGYGIPHIAQLGLVDLPAGFASGYGTFSFKIKSADLPGNFILVKLQDGGPYGDVVLTNTAISTPLGNGWYQVVLPMSGFTGVNTATGVVFEAQDQNTGFSFLVTDIGFSGTAGGGGGGGGGGTGELVTDGGFEAAGAAGSGLQPPWFVFANGGTASISNTNSNGGTYSVRLQANASSGPSFPIVKVERLAGGGALTGGASVTISFDAIDVDTAGAGKTFVAEFFTERSDPPGGATNEVILGGYGLSGTWQTYTFNTNLGADAAGGVSLLFKADCGANPACTMDVFIDNVSIVVN